MNVKKELTKGSSMLLVLSTLKEKHMYGYAIIKEIEKLSENVFAFKEGTLYPILHSMEQQGYVKSYWQDSDTGRKRKYYHLTQKGIKELAEAEKEWNTYSEAVGKVIREKTISVSV